MGAQPLVGFLTNLWVGEKLASAVCSDAVATNVGEHPTGSAPVLSPGSFFFHSSPSQGGGRMYREVFVPVDNSQHSDWAVERAIELCQQSGGRITGNHVYAARLHDVRFRQLETGLPAQFQTPEEIKKQRKVHDKLIEKGLQLIADSFLDQLGKRCESAGVALTRQLLEGINYEEIVREVNRGEGRLPGLIGFDPNRAAGYDGGDKVRSDVKLGENGRLVAEEEDAAARLVGSS